MRLFCNELVENFKLILLFIDIVIFLYLQALADPYFYGLANLETEPSKQPISKLEFDFEKRRLTKNDVRELIYREVCSYFSIIIDLALNLFFMHCLMVLSSFLVHRF